MKNFLYREIVRFLSSEKGTFFIRKAAHTGWESHVGVFEFEDFQVMNMPFHPQGCGRERSCVFLLCPCSFLYKIQKI